MRWKPLTILTLVFMPAAVLAAPDKTHGVVRGTVEISRDATGPIINRDIFGQFAEHLGEGIYGGVWVGTASKIPNVRGIRSDVVAALRAIKVPVVRWPGGCFADEYNWRNGVGPADQRKATVNGNWGNVIEPNTFGTHEFMEFVEQIGSEAYININIGTDTPRAAADWLEYMTTDQPSDLGKQRERNGHRAPWRIKYLGIGNESWGCGGNMSADAYVEKLKLFATFVRNLNPAQGRENRYVPAPNEMMRIAVGPEDEKPEYTDAVMKAWKETKPWRWGFEGLSLHHYTMGRTPLSSPATGFSVTDYAYFLRQTSDMDALISKHSAIMDQYDPRKKVSLAVDEWGVWLAPLPGTNPRFLKQQNSLRDGILASLNLNIFARHADRVRMANVAQMVNVLQSMILTDGDRMVLTPTYQVFRMYVPFQDAKRLAVRFQTENYSVGDISVPQVDTLAAEDKNGKAWVALTNVDPDKPARIVIKFEGRRVGGVSGETLSGPRIDSVNTFDEPSQVMPTRLEVRGDGTSVTVTLPPKSVSVLQVLN